jgi:hypothetical protein
VDPAAVLRASVVAAAACVGGAACGSATAAARPEAPASGLSADATRAGVVTAGDPAAVHRDVAEALRRSGQPCRATAERVVCEGDGEVRASYYVVYRPYPARLLFGSPWLLRGPCADATSALNAFNWSYDELSASCDERGALIVQGAYFVPAAGLTGDDVVAFARWWTIAEVRALQASEVAPLLR